MAERLSTNTQPPAGLADVLNPSPDNRDSAYYSGGSTGEQSKHASVVSNNIINYTSSPSGGYHSDSKTTPPPISTLNSPTTAGMSVASMVSPSTPSSAHMDRSMLDKLNRGPADASQRSSCISSIGEGRRDSIDSRGISGSLDQMKLNSPYGSNHPSTTSIQATLQQQRDPRNGPERLSASRFPSSYSANSIEDPGSRRGRMAPAITGPAAPQFAHGANPVQGQAWAGPFEFDRITPTEAAESSRHTSYLDSRRNSVAESFASNASQLTTESSLPRGQRRLEDGYADGYTPRRERSSADLATTHHHQLKHKAVENLMDQEGNSPGGSSQPYSRTPELRVSHKLAERKRRDEMKQLYDNLRDLMPQERGNKASKWEILSKAIQEHRSQLSQIHNLKEHNRSLQDELLELRREAHLLKEENRQLRSYPPSSASQAPPPHHVGHQSMPTPSSMYQQHGEHERGMFNRAEPHRESAPLPPLRAYEPSAPHGQEPMNGVQYSYSATAPTPPQTAFRHESAYGRA